ncbi:MAG: hypothetical protein R6T83_12265 [Salinibacter sp.]
MDADASVEELHDWIETALRGDLDEQWDEVLDQWTTAAPSDRKAVRSYVSGLRNRMLRALLAIDTEEDLRRAVATQYIEAKCHWTMLNLQIQHQTARQEDLDPPLLYRATCVSLIVQQLEPLLSQEHADRLTQFLAEPLE